MDCSRYWAILCLFSFLFLPLVAGPTERLATVNPADLSEILVNHSVNPVTGAYHEEQVDLTSPGFHALTATRRFGAQPQEPCVALGHGWWLCFEADAEQVVTDHWTEVRRLSPDRTCVLNWMRYRHIRNEDGSAELRLESCDARSCRYHLQQGLLTQVESSMGHTIRYEYQTGSPVPTKRQDQLGHYLINTLDPASGRIVSQLAPVGADASPVLAMRYEYQKDRTIVTDAAGGRTVYHHRQGRLDAIDTESGGTVYRRERFTYCGERLRSYALLGSQAKAVAVRAFFYDAKGHCTQSTLFGDLTGKGIAEFDLASSGLPRNSQVESDSIRYCYSNDEPARLLSVREDNGKTVTFDYDESGHLIAKYLWDHATICQRLFYRYDAQGTLTGTLVDDGTSSHPDDLQGVTERHVTSMTTRTQLPGYGLPILIDEKYWDCERQTECLQRSTIRGYDTSGRLVKEDYFDGNAAHCGSIDYQYDAKGRLQSTVDATGQVKTISYTPRGVQCADDNGEADYRYDLAGRLICKAMRDEQGRVFTSHFRYNLLGQMVESIDLYGNSTDFTYDALGRCVKTQYPAISTAGGGSVQPTIERRYDLLDRLTTIHGANGDQTQVRYNVRGQAVDIAYADGTRERFRYGLDGGLVEQINRQGISTQYRRDCCGRIVEKSLIATDGQRMTMQAFYNSCHLTGFVSPSGEQTLFSYDGAGRLVDATTQWDSGEQQRAYHYDVNGRLQEVCERFGIEAKDCSRLLIEGHANRHASVRIVDSNDRELVSKEYLQPAQSTDNVHCDMAFENALGQKVLRKTITDALGKRTIVTHDALGHVAELEECDGLGKCLSRRSFQYDPAGHCTGDQVHSSDGSVVWTVTKRYGPLNRLEELSEAVGTPQESHTTYSYHPSGMLATVIKPNGIQLHYAYDGFGRLAELTSSDRSVGYRYFYDDGSRPNRIEDLIHGSRTECTYNSRGDLLHETLAHGLSMLYQRDGKGRLIHLELPDQSAVHYHYDAALLRSVERQDSQGNVRYVHQYEAYTPEGDLETEQLICDIGAVKYVSDNEGRRCAIQSRFWSESIPTTSRDAAGNITQIDVTDPGGSYRMRFAYDCQGRLIAEGGSGTTDSYRYDAANNRISMGLGRHEVNSAQQVFETPHARYQYDANGNRIGMQAEGDDVRYTYDALDRLIQVEICEKQRVQYFYDASHRRLVKTVFLWDVDKRSWVQQSMFRYLYEGQHEIAEVDEQGRVRQLQVLGTGIAGHLDSAVALEIGEALYAPIHDHRGSVVCLVDAQRGTVAEYSRTSAFGEESLFSGDAKALTPEQSLNPWRFSGKRYDQETGCVYFGRRYYDPKLGRWLTRDPQGEIDGINDYVFVRNNPEALIDKEGLFSLQSVWRDCSEMALECFRGAWAHSIYEALSFLTDINDHAMYIGHQLIGPRIWEVVGFYSAQPESGVVGSHEVSDHLRFSHINGIQNTRDDALRAIVMISNLHGGVNVHYTYRPTAGWTWDCVNACLVKVGFTSPTSYCLAEKWKRLIDDMGGVGGGGTIIHYAHSLGGVETANARHLMTSEEQGMIRVFTFGSPFLMPSEGFQSVTNYVSRLDPIPALDPVTYLVGFLGSSDNIVFVGTYWGIPVLDHSLVNDAYRQVLDALGKNYRE